MSNNKKFLTLDELLNHVQSINKNFINELEREDTAQHIETVDTIRNAIIGDKNETERLKRKFIEEIKNGLGDIIKLEPKPKIIKKKWHEKLLMLIKRIFAKF